MARLCDETLLEWKEDGGIKDDMKEFDENTINIR